VLRHVHSEKVSCVVSRFQKSRRRAVGTLFGIAGIKDGSLSDMVVYLATGVLVAFSFIPNQVGESTCNFSVFTFRSRFPYVRDGHVFIQFERQIRRQHESLTSGEETRRHHLTSTYESMKRALLKALNECLHVEDYSRVVYLTPRS
jgi:hypothetical protein